MTSLLGMARETTKQEIKTTKLKQTHQIIASFRKPYQYLIIAITSAVSCNTIDLRKANISESGFMLFTVTPSSKRSEFNRLPITS